MAAESPFYSRGPRSPKERDDELSLQIQMRLFNDRRPLVGQCLREISGDCRTGVNLDIFGFWRIRAIHKGSADAMLFLTPDQPATRELFEGDYDKDDATAMVGPSDRWTEWRDHGWPGVIRGQPATYLYQNAGDYLGASVQLDEIPYTVAPTKFTFDVFWTSTDPDDDVVKPNRPQPSIVYWRYPGVNVTGGGASRTCLHEEIESLPLSGVTTWFGRASKNLNVPGMRFFRTNQISWIKHIHNVHKKELNGSFRTIVEWAEPPFSSLRYPASPEQFTS